MREGQDAATRELPVVIARFHDEAVAQLAAGLLELEDIEPFVWTRVPTRGLGQREASLSVLPSDIERALAILSNSPARDHLV